MRYNKIIFIMCMFLLLNISTASAVICDGTLLKNKAINISSTSNITNYQIMLNITYDSDMNTTYQDLRFFNSSCGNISYWIANSTTTWATIWIKTSVSAPNTIIYMYYKNPAYVNMSSITNTMIFGYDAREADNMTNKFDISGGTVNKSYRIINGTLEIDAGGATEYFFLSKSTYSLPNIFETKLKIQHTANSYSEWGLGDLGTGYTIASYNRWSYAEIGLAYISKNSTETKDTTADNITSVYHTYKMITNTSKIWYYYDDVNVKNHTASIPTSPMKVRYEDFNANNNLTIIYGFLRTFAETTPSYSIGAEQDTNDAPTIVLDSPTDLSTSSTVNVIHTFTPTDNAGFSNCSVWSNNSGSWAVMQSNTSAISNNSINTIIATYSGNGIYLWAIECWDNGATRLNTFSTNRTLTISATNATVSSTLNVFFYDEITNASINYNDYGLYNRFNNIVYSKYMIYDSYGGTITDPTYACDVYNTTTPPGLWDTGEYIICQVGLGTKNETIYYNFGGAGSPVLQIYDYSLAVYTQIATKGIGSINVDNTNGKYTQNGIAKLKVIDSAGGGGGTAYYSFNTLNFGQYQIINYNTTSTSLILYSSDVLGSYSERQKYITLSNTTQNISVYLIKKSEGLYTCYNVVSAFGTPATDATIKVYHSSYGLIHQQSVDSSGTAAFYLNPFTTYTIDFVSATYGNKTITSQPQTTTCQTMQFGANVTWDYSDEMQDIRIEYTPFYMTWNTNASYNITITALGTANIIGYGANMTYPNGTLISSITYSSVNVTTATFNINETITYSGENILNIYFTKQGFGQYNIQRKFYTMDTVTQNNLTIYNAITDLQTTNSVGLNEYELGGILLIIMIATAIGTAQFGMIGTVLTIAVGSFFVILNVLSLSAFIIFSLIAIIIMLALEV